MVAPDLVDQLGPAVDAFGMVHQEIEQPKFDRAKRNLARAGGDALGTGIEAQTGHLHRIVSHLRHAPAQHGVDAGDQFARPERLGQVVVGAAFEGHDLVGLTAPRGHHDDRQIARGRAGAQAANQRDARLARQIPFEDQHVWQLLFAQCLIDDDQCRLGIAATIDVVAGARKIQCHQLLHSRVVDYENTEGHKNPVASKPVFFDILMSRRQVKFYYAPGLST